MVRVIGVRFPNAGKLYFFTPGELWPSPGDYVVVETMHGVSLGEVVMPVHEIDETVLSSPLKEVMRIASEEDLVRDRENHVLEKQSEAIALQKIHEHRLPMKLVGTEYTFDRAKVIFYFTADGRVDFRALVRDLSSALRPRVELRQIGVRDEARMMGGLGPCGRPICCAGFLGDFQSVSIKMAKNQNLSMNPAKISGICGKLMCCIKFEEETYEQIIREMPAVNSRVNTPDGPGIVTNLYVAREAVRVKINRGDSGELHDYQLDVLKECNPEWKEENRAKRSETPSACEMCKPCPRRQEKAVSAEKASAGAVKAAAEEKAAAEKKAAGTKKPAETAAEPEKPVHPAAEAEKAPAAEPASTGISWRERLNQAMKAAAGQENADSANSGKST